MENEKSGNSAQGRRIAFLIDADNVSSTKIASMIAELSKYGTANIRRAYGDWSATGLKGWKEKLHDFAIRPVQQFSYSTGKNATDLALVIDAMELHYTQKLDAFCIASSDADFTPLVMQLKANGHDVYGFGERKTPAPFVNACTRFVYLDGLDAFEISAMSAAPQLLASDKSKPTAKKVATTVKRKPAPTAAAVPDKKLSQDTKLIKILRGAVEANAREDGWSAMSAVGSFVKRQTSIDLKNYGCKNFQKLFEVTELFIFSKASGGQMYVADKKNKERSPQPE
jgi:uncharacterized protein (TIGR00288 family)